MHALRRPTAVAQSGCVVLIGGRRQHHHGPDDHFPRRHDTAQVNLPISPTVLQEGPHRHKLLKCAYRCPMGHLDGASRAAAQDKDGPSLRDILRNRHREGPQPIAGRVKEAFCR